MVVLVCFGAMLHEDPVCDHEPVFRISVALYSNESCFFGNDIFILSLIVVEICRSPYVLTSLPSRFLTAIQDAFLVTPSLKKQIPSLSMLQTGAHILVGLSGLLNPPTRFMYCLYSVFLSFLTPYSLSLPGTFVFFVLLKPLKPINLFIAVSSSSSGSIGAGASSALTFGLR